MLVNVRDEMTPPLRGFIRLFLFSIIYLYARANDHCETSQRSALQIKRYYCREILYTACRHHSVSKVNDHNDLCTRYVEKRRFGYDFKTRRRETM